MNKDMKRTKMHAQIMHCGIRLERLVYADKDKIPYIKINNAFFPLNDFMIVSVW